MKQLNKHIKNGFTDAIKDCFKVRFYLLNKYLIIALNNLIN